MSSNRNRDGKGPFGREGTLGKPPQVVGCDDVDPGNVSPFEHQTVHAGIHPILRVPGNHDGSRNCRATIQSRKDGYRKLIEVHVTLLQHHLFHWTVLNQIGFDGPLHGPLKLFLNLFIGNTHSEGETISRLEQPGDHRQRVTNGIGKNQGLV